MDSWDEESVDFNGNEAETESLGENHAQPEKRKQKGVHTLNNKRIKYGAISGEGETTKRNNKNNQLFKPPTVEELNDLKTTENLYNNSLFRLQIEELIKEVTIKNKRKKALDNWLHSFKNILNNLPSYNEISISEIKPISKQKKITKQDKFINNLSNYKICGLKADQDVILKLQKPDRYECFGLYECNSLAGPNLETSINIKMPKTYFHVKDFLNNRYLVKRFYYLAYIAEHLTVHEKHLMYSNSNILLPILHIQPTEDEKLTIKIHVSPPDDYFRPSRFLPNQNNIKQDLFESQIRDLEVLKTSPTILYNSVVAHDVTLTQNMNFVKEILNDHANIQEGVKLICVWLKQRQLDNGFGAFTMDLVIYFISYLLQKKKVNKFMSSYQIVRNFWNFLSAGLNAISLSEVKSDTMDMFKNVFPIVCLDVTGCYNLASFLDADVFKKVRLECQLAMKHLDESKVESFQALFLTKLPFALQFDVLLEVSEALPLTDKFASTDTEKSRSIGYEKFLPIRHLSNLLQRGLSKRILNIVPHIDVEYPQGITRVLFGINLNPETAFNFIEMGPALNEYAEAEEFRKFWGYLSSDRRFRDGSTHVAVYFKTSTIRGKRGIIKRIIKYMLQEKININFKLYYDEFDEFLLNRSVQTPFPVGTNEESTLKIISLSDELGQKLRSVELSLSITGIQGLSDAFSYTSVFPPVATKYKLSKMTEIKGNNMIISNKKLGMMPRYVEPLDLVLQLEHSSKWPNNIEAIRHVKTSFYLEIAKMLDNHDIKTNVTKDYLEVFYGGLVFRHNISKCLQLLYLSKPAERNIDRLNLFCSLWRRQEVRYKNESLKIKKTSFYLEIAKMLDNHDIKSNVTKDYLEVFYGGLVFRYRLYVPKEIGLMKKEILEDGTVKYAENDKSSEMEKRLNILPKVNAALKGLQLQFPSLGPSTALVKRWMRSHLIDEFHLSDVVINLLNASLYTSITSFSESCTPQIAFLRFLKFIAELQWELQPVVVNFNEEISKEDIADLESNFQQNREAVQPLYIIMPYDQGKSIFTKENPSKEILYRVQQLAEASLKLTIDRMENHNNLFDLKELFKPNMEGYDLLIHLDPLMNAKRHELLGSTEHRVVLEEYKQHKNEKIPIVGFNPVDLYVESLRENYGYFATFFYDTYGGNTVGALWNPKAKEAKDFKISYVGGRRLEGDKLVLNEDAIIEDFYILGKDIVKWIEKK